MKKIKAICTLAVIAVLAVVGIQYIFRVSDEKGLEDRINVSEYRLPVEGFLMNGEYLILGIENTEPDSIGVQVKASFYDEDGNIIDEDSAEVEGISPGMGYFLQLYSEKKFADCKTEINAWIDEGVTVDHKPIGDDVAVNCERDGQSVVIEAKNNGKETTKELMAQALFLKGDQVVDFREKEIFHGELPARDKTEVTLTSSEKWSDVIYSVHGYYEK